MREKQISLWLAATILLPSAAVGDWHTGVGGRADRNGLSAEIGPVTDAILWEGSRPAIVAQQGVCDGDLLVVSRIQNFTIPTGTWIVAHDLHTGDERWAVQLPYDFPGTSWRSRVSAVRDGLVYATRSGNTNFDYLYALDPSDGDIVWRSEALISEGSTESLAFAPNGDLIAGNSDSLLRINHADGTTVWSTSRTCPSSDGCLAAVHGDRVYVWEASGSGPKVTAFDLASGDRLFSSGGIGGGYVQQLGLMCGPDGTVYAPRTQNNPITDFFVALADTGGGFKEKWRIPMGYTPFASFGVGPDGSVYTTSRDDELLRLDPTTGEILDASFPIPSDFPFKPRIAIDAAGKVFLTNGGFAAGALYVFTADLTMLWSAPVVNVNLGGPLLGDAGTLVVCGTGTDVRAYRTEGVAVAGVPGAHRPGLLGQNVPNPFGSRTSIPFECPGDQHVRLEIFDLEGRCVRSILEGPLAAGSHLVAWDGRDEAARRVAPGVYFSRLVVGGESWTRRMVVTP